MGASETPAAGTTGAPKNPDPDKALDSCVHSSRLTPPPELTAAEVYEIIRGRLVAHLIVKDHRGRVTTRPYRNIGAADRAMRRARERGCAATVVMVRQDVAPLLGGDL